MANTQAYTIRKVTPVRTNSVVTTLAGLAGSAGSTDGTGSIARFNAPTGVAVDSAGNVYVADFHFNTIRKGYPPPRILNSGFVGGQFRFDLTGPPGHSMVVKASTDLANWLPLCTNTLSGALTFADVDGSLHPSRYYRARLP